MDFAIQLAKIEATKYADNRGYDEGSVHYVNQYNAYLAGYMANAAERESLRVIAARKSTPPEATGLDDLV